MDSDNLATLLLKISTVFKTKKDCEDFMNAMESNIDTRVQIVDASGETLFSIGAEIVELDLEEFNNNKKIPQDVPLGG